MDEEKEHTDENEDDIMQLAQGSNQWKIEWQDVAEKDRPNTAASALKACDKRCFPYGKGCLESCALYRLYQLSAKGHLVA